AGEAAICLHCCGTGIVTRKVASKEGCLKAPRWTVRRLARESERSYQGGPVVRSASASVDDSNVLRATQRAGIDRARWLRQTHRACPRSKKRLERCACTTRCVGRSASCQIAVAFNQKSSWSNTYNRSRSNGLFTSWISDRY